MSNPRLSSTIGTLIMILMLLFIVFRPTTIKIDCVGCVSVPETNVGAKPAEQKPAATPSTKLPLMSTSGHCGDITLPNPPSIVPLPPKSMTMDDKQYIVALTQQINAYEVSIKEYKKRVEDTLNKYNLSCK